LAEAPEAEALAEAPGAGVRPIKLALNLNDNRNHLLFFVLCVCLCLALCLELDVISLSDVSSFNMERVISIKGSIENMSRAEAMISAKLRQSYESDLQVSISSLCLLSFDSQ